MSFFSPVDRPAKKSREEKTVLYCVAGRLDGSLVVCAVVTAAFGSVTIKPCNIKHFQCLVCLPVYGS